MTALGRLACLVAAGLMLCVPAFSPGRAADPAVPVAVTTWKGDPRFVFKWRRDVEFEVEERGGEARIRFLAPGKIDVEALAKAKSFAPRVVSGPRGDTVILKLPADRRLRPARSGKSIVIDVVPAPRRRVTVPLAARTPPPLPRPRPKPPEESVAASAASASSVQRLLGSVVVRSSWQEHRHYIRFDWPRPVAAAVFRRGNWIWVVFDQALPVTFANEKKAELIRPVPHPSATVFRIAAPSGFNPTMARVGSAWVVDLQDQALRPEHPVRAEPYPQAIPPRIRFGLRLAASAPIEVVDPDLGERLLVVPNNELGEGLPRSVAFVDFQALASAQGLVLQPTGQPLSISATHDGVEVMARDGLALARASSRPPADATDYGARLLDFAAWAAPPGRHLERRQALSAAAARAPESRRTAARLELARFYLAEGFAPEAYGVLQAIARDDPGVFAQPGPRLLEGAAAFLAGRPEEAADALASPSLDGEGEAALWRAAVASSKGDWASAALGFAQAEPILSAYPKKIRHALSLAGARAAVAAGQGDAARSLLEPLLEEEPAPGDRGAALLLVARMHHQQGDIGKAVQIWNELASGRDKASRVRAQLERTLALLDKKLIEPGPAIEQLETVRSEWRGDEIEFRTLRALAALKARSGDWRGSFEAFRQLEAHFPEAEDLSAATEEAVAALVELFGSPAFAEVPPLAAYKLFEHYAKRVPPGERRDAIARPLVDRLDAIDLPAHAASVLETQLEDRAVDGKTAGLVTRLAALRLAEGKPEAALAALALPAGEIPPALAVERTYIEARALARQARAADALAALGDDTTPAADRIRLEILTRAKNWKETLPVYARLAPPLGGSLDAASARLVLNWASAATLAGDDEAVATIREAYGARMDESDDRDAFRLVVGDLRPTPQRLAAAR
jgi:hypothetical protein